MGSVRHRLDVDVAVNAIIERRRDGAAGDIDLLAGEGHNGLRGRGEDDFLDVDVLVLEISALHRHDHGRIGETCGHGDGDLVIGGERRRAHEAGGAADDDASAIETRRETPRVHQILLLRFFCLY